MNFKNWINTNEVRGQVGGAFGKDPFRTKPQQPSQPIKPNEYDPQGRRLSNQFQDINKRVEYGKGIEQQIFDSLVKCGLKLRPPTTQEDKYDKVDGWWTTSIGEKPIQIKYRDSGNDILFEVMKDYRKGIPGRDMIGKAQYYAVLSKTGGQIVVIDVAHAKNIIEKIKDLAESQGFDNRGNFSYQGVQLKLRPDPHSGQEKLMAYLPISVLKQVTPPCIANIRY